ncbi:signal sequence receptor alpha subunit [Colletotrichum truncatum]|uniref:Signal sequence receptor alpha subunit n=1 Tax=Colletotrichum truncatum TaxID=5467 RepID=A0ACC3YKU0_COLTU|nr:signal sequence receptor alpha subunit [Colletotrichum truncatum]XP_036576206.1 signal sequence receptor alpha subunit [Colletotrichum truncatum]KAF6780574.1 signal sequence receptor alpha subunit [Colletotrichum truncatum]KAF6782895.1 signal sequence receptor alpha subunit [Colletotrichum truncatum]
MSSLPQQVCPTWVFASGSNAHACKNRAWFTEYIPFESVTYNYVGEGPRVYGVGTVELPIAQPPRADGLSMLSTLRLENVLHTPDSICNVIGGMLPLNLIGGRKGGDGFGRYALHQADGHPVVYSRPGQTLFVVQLRKPPSGLQYGPSTLEEDVNYVINVSWPESERERFKDHLRQSDGVSQEAGYTRKEKQWLKKLSN